MHEMKKYGLLVFLVVLDQITKLGSRMNLGELPLEITSFFRLKLVENTGIAFSFPLPFWVILTLTFIVIAILGRLFHQTKFPSLQGWALVLILAGAIGNLIDRVWLGAVTDFLSFWNFAIFNVADACISLGVGIWFWSELKNNKQQAANH